MTPEQNELIEFGRKQGIKEVYDKLFKGFKMPKDGFEHRRGWGDCRQEVLRIIKEM